MYYSSHFGLWYKPDTALYMDAHTGTW
jgi:hypothetical protein